MRSRPRAFPVLVQPLLQQLWLVVCLGFLAGCQSQTPNQSEPVNRAQAQAVELPGVDTSKLTARERTQWSKYVNELLAPCSNQPVSLAQCVLEKRDCEACLPASQFLAVQVTRGKTRSQAEAAFRQRFGDESVKSIDIGDSPARGASDPVVTVVEWADFECPFCGMAAPLIEAAVSKYPDKVRFAFKNFPLSMHEHAEQAARASMAAAKQGKFWEMHHELFTHQQELDDAGLLKLAASIGLDLKQFEADRKSEEVADRVTRDRKQAEALGLQGTPSLYINGRFFDMDHFELADDLEAWLALEIKLRTGANQAAAPAGGAEAAASTGVAQ